MHVTILSMLDPQMPEHVPQAAQGLVLPKAPGLDAAGADTTTRLIQHWANEQACQGWAAQLAGLIGPLLRAQASILIELRGTLGAGKTTFTRHFLRALGVEGRIKSPSYAVVEPYELPGMALWHFDFYRFADPQEWEDAGFRDIFASAGLKLVEWPDKAAGLLPPADLSLHLDVGPLDMERQALWEAGTPTGCTLLHPLRAGSQWPVKDT
jgi:tRNA threonylcarbamoyladenosine biosynthesis protein TsaE